MEKSNFPHNPHSINTVSVIGAGAWGTTLARLLCTRGLTVKLWAFEREVVEAVRATHENTTYLSGIRLPDLLEITGTFPESVQGTDLIILAVPSHAMHTIVAELLPSLGPAGPLVIATKGIEEDSLCLMSQVVEGILPSNWHPYVCVLSGPSFAREVCEGKPTTVLLAGKNISLVNQLQQVFMAPGFRVYSGRDLIGAQVGGALKNVMAIASGIVDGLSLGFNARAALITRGLAEMVRLGVALGAQVSTLYGLSGLGDLVLTCTGSLSRNYTVGMKLGRGQQLDQILAETQTVAEGIRTTRAAMELADRHGVEMPIVRGVYGVLFGGLNPGQAVEELMARAAKSEAEDSGTEVQGNS